MNSRFVLAALISLGLSLFFTAQVQAKGIHLKAGDFSPKSMTTMDVLSVSKVLETNYYIVQFKDTVSEIHLAQLKKHNIIVIRYIPDDAYLVKSQTEDILALELTGTVEGILPYLGSFKLSPEFEKFKNSKEKQIVVIQLAQLVEKLSVLKKLKAYDVKNIHQGRFIEVEILNSDLEYLSTIDGIEWIQPKAQFKPMHMEFTTDDQLMGEATTSATGDYTDLNGFESGVKIMNFEKAWSLGYEGQDQIVAMADTGLDSGTMATLSKDFAGVFDGQIIGLLSDSWGDPMGHGTHVAGSVIGQGFDSNGVVTGGAIQAGMLAQGMWSKKFKNLTVPVKLKNLFQKAYDRDAKIHTNSWGSPFSMGSYDKNAMLVDEFMWENPDMLIIFAAGNSGKDADSDGRIDLGSVSSPGTAKNALTVGASENLVSQGGIQRTHGELRGGSENWGVSPIKEDTLSNNANGIAMFSSRGPAKDGRIKPEIVAPGTNILSNCSREQDASPLWGNYNANYCWSGGTSMSTPLTAGAAAIAREFLVKAKGITQPSGAMIKALLMHTATDLFPGQYGLRDQGQEMLVTAPNNQQGFGRVNMEAVTAAQALVLVVDEKVGVATAGKTSYYLNIQGQTEAVITLVYTDAPGSPSASTALVNDVNINVKLERSGQVYKGEREIDNFEQIRISGLTVDENLKITVTGKRVAQGKNGKQPYSLLVTLK